MHLHLLLLMQKYRYCPEHRLTTHTHTSDHAGNIMITFLPGVSPHSSTFGSSSYLSRNHPRPKSLSHISMEAFDRTWPNIFHFSCENPPKLAEHRNISNTKPALGLLGFASLSLLQRLHLSWNLAKDPIRILCNQSCGLHWFLQNHNSEIKFFHSHNFSYSY